MTDQPTPNRLDQGFIRSKGLFGGFQAPLAGARFMWRHPRLITLTLIPVLLNALIYIIIIALILKYLHSWLETTIPAAQAWYWAALVWLATLLTALLLLLGAVFTFVALSSILASPFYDAISARTEELITGRKEADSSWSAVIKEFGRSIIEEIKKIVFYVAILGILALINLIPLIGSVLFAVLSALLTVYWLGLNFVDYTLVRHQYRLGGKIRFIRRNWFTCFGYGLGILVGLLIPFLNLLVAPMAVVGGTMLYLELRGPASDNPD